MNEEYLDYLKVIESQLKDDYIDFGLHDEIALDIIKEAIKLYRAEFVY